jgi:hypothetical protein
MSQQKERGGSDDPTQQDTGGSDDPTQQDTGGSDDSTQRDTGGSDVSTPLDTMSHTALPNWNVEASCHCEPIDPDPVVFIVLYDMPTHRALRSASMLYTRICRQLN